MLSARRNTICGRQTDLIQSVCHELIVGQERLQELLSPLCFNAPVSNDESSLLVANHFEKVIFEVVVFSGLIRVCSDETPPRQLIGIPIVME
jgi:hypothetical protein